MQESFGAASGGYSLGGECCFFRYLFGDSLFLRKDSLLLQDKFPFLQNNILLFQKNFRNFQKTNHLQRQAEPEKRRLTARAAFHSLSLFRLSAYSLSLCLFLSLSLYLYLFPLWFQFPYLFPSPFPVYLWCLFPLLFVGLL